MERTLSIGELARATDTKVEIVMLERSRRLFGDDQPGKMQLD